MCVEVEGICSILADAKVIVVPERGISTEEDATTIPCNNSQFYLVSEVAKVGILSCASMVSTGTRCNDLVSTVCKGTRTKLSRLRVPIVALAVITQWIVEYQCCPSRWIGVCVRVRGHSSSGGTISTTSL